MFEPTTDSGAYILGILWGICSPMGDDGYWLRHRNPLYIQAVREHLGLSTLPHLVESRTGPQVRLKIVRRSEVALLAAILQSHGWAPRQALQRPYPAGVIDDRGFVRAWVELHASADVARIGRHRTETPRLRIYGNWDMLDEVNRVIASGSGLTTRAVQRTGNISTKALYYQGRSYQAVAEWLYSNCEMSNPTARERILSPL